MNVSSSKILLKLDIKNAFNSIERDSMLQIVKDKIPSLYPFLWQSYRYPSNLFFHRNVISSQTGAQQGDPTGPLLFSLTLHPIISKLNSQLNFFYLDDGVLCDEANVVLADFQKLIAECKSIGLDINPSKCELYFCSTIDEIVMSAFEKVAPGIKIVCRPELTLLGTPIMLEGIENIAQKKLESIKTFWERLLSLNSHTAYFLLKNCLAIPKLTYFIRTTPLWLFPSLLQYFDDGIRSTLESILNIPLDDHNWTQASLPINFGGLGIRKITDICLPAFMASAYGVSDFIKSVLSIQGDELVISHMADAFEVWDSVTGFQGTPSQPKIQKNWDLLSVSKIHQTLANSLSSDQDQARLLAVQAKESSSWLQALPSSNVGTLLDDLSFRIAVALRLGCKLCQPHKCICGSWVDTYGHHGLSCPKSAGRFSRHFQLNDIIRRALISAKVPAVLEPVGINRTDGKRPDGLTLIPWTKGRSLIWDATCVDTLAPSHLASTSKTTGSAAASAANKKLNKYRDLVDQYFFVGFAVETMGPWCKEAKALVLDIGRRLISATGETRSCQYLSQRLSIAIQRGNATSIMGTFAESSSLDQIFYFHSFS